MPEVLQLAQVVSPVEQLRHGLWQAVQVDPMRKSAVETQERQADAEVHVEQGAMHRSQVLATVLG